MFDKLFSPETIEETLRILRRKFLAFGETVYVTHLAPAFCGGIGLPLGVASGGGREGRRAAPAKGWRDAYAECHH